MKIPSNLSNLSAQDIEALQALQEQQTREDQARRLLNKYGYDEDSVIDFNHAIEILMEALKR